MKLLSKWLRISAGMGAFLIIFMLMSSCKERRHGIDYRFNEKSEGWYFLVYEQTGERILETVRNRLQVEYPKGERLVVTSSKPQFGWAKDHFYIDGKEVGSSYLGGVYPSRFVKVTERGKTLQYKEFYLGNYENIDRHPEPEKILKKLLEEKTSK